MLADSAVGAPPTFPMGAACFGGGGNKHDERELVSVHDADFQGRTRRTEELAPQIINGESVNILHTGWLLKQGSSTTCLDASWNTRYFVLKTKRVMYYYERRQHQPAREKAGFPIDGLGTLGARADFLPCCTRADVIRVWARPPGEPSGSIDLSIGSMDYAEETPQAPFPFLVRTGAALGLAHAVALPLNASVLLCGIPRFVPYSAPTYSERIPRRSDNNGLRRSLRSWVARYVEPLGRTSLSGSSCFHCLWVWYTVLAGLRGQREHLGTPRFLTPL